MAKSRSKILKFRYIKIEGVEQEELDRYLVEMFSKAELSNRILADRILSIKLSYNRLELLNQSVPYEQLVNSIIEQLEFCYDAYNRMMNDVYPSLQKLEDEIKRNKEYSKFTNNEERLNYIVDEMVMALREDPFNINKLICWLRLKPNLHNHLRELMEEERKVEVKEDMKTTEMDKKIENTIGQESFSQQLSYLKNMIISMEQQAKQIDNENREELKSKIVKLEIEMNEVKKQLTGKEKEIKSKEKEAQKFQKKYDDECKKNEVHKETIGKHQKVIGETSKKLGDVRKELVEEQSKNKILEQTVNRLENIKEQVESKMKADFEKTLNSKLALIKMEYQEEIDSLLDSQDRTQKMNEKLYEDLKVKYDELKNENNGLKSKMKEMELGAKRKEIEKETSKDPNEKVKVETEELIDLFGTNEFEPEFS